MSIYFLLFPLRATALAPRLGLRISRGACRPPPFGNATGRREQESYGRWKTFQMLFSFSSRSDSPSLPLLLRLLWK